MTYINLKKAETNEVLGIQLVYGAFEEVGPWLETSNAGDEPNEYPLNRQFDILWISMLTSSEGPDSENYFEGIKNLAFAYQNDKKESKWPGNPYEDSPGWTSNNLQKCSKIVGVKAKTDDPSGVITRIDFLIGNGRVYNSEC